MADSHIAVFLHKGGTAMGSGRSKIKFETSECLVNYAVSKELIKGSNSISGDKNLWNVVVYRGHLLCQCLNNGPILCTHICTSIYKWEGL